MKHLFSALLVGLLLTTCKERTSEDPQNQLPPITQNGANTAGCLVNGKVLVPKNGTQNFGGPPAYGLFISRLYGSFRLDIKNYKNDGFVHMYISKLDDNKVTYNIGQSDGQPFEPHSNSSEAQLYAVNNNNIYISSANSGTISITKNSYPIISGTFSASLYNKDNPSEKIQITDGRFDINVATLNKYNRQIEKSDFCKRNVQKK
ncbi:hypothetical protein [Riemerella columbina]|uniref:hypothetical protein n=1 Tax=Riemerella columbina TaxID=103810 RepID=UPI000372FC70|nr:hypothetical protein [Riemerella columbina]